MNIDPKKFFNFDIFISVNIIKVLYFLTFIGVTIASISMPFIFSFDRHTDFWSGRSSSTFNPGGFTGGIFMGVVLFVLGQLSARIYYELLIVVLKINENLQKVVDGGDMPVREFSPSSAYAPPRSVVQQPAKQSYSPPGSVVQQPAKQSYSPPGSVVQQSIKQSYSPPVPLTLPREQQPGVTPKYCPKCLSELKLDATFCEDCGQKV